MSKRAAESPKPREDPIAVLIQVCALDAPEVQKILATASPKPPQEPTKSK